MASNSSNSTTAAPGASTGALTSGVSTNRMSSILLVLLSIAGVAMASNSSNSTTAAPGASTGALTSGAVSIAMPLAMLAMAFFLLFGLEEALGVKNTLSPLVLGQGVFFWRAAYHQQLAWSPQPPATLGLYM